MLLFVFVILAIRVGVVNVVGATLFLGCFLILLFWERALRIAKEKHNMP